MSNYTKENLIAIPPTAVPDGTLAHFSIRAKVDHKGQNFELPGGFVE